MARAGCGWSRTASEGGSVASERASLVALEHGLGDALDVAVLAVGQAALVVLLGSSGQRVSSMGLVGDRIAAVGSGELAGRKLLAFGGGELSHGALPFCRAPQQAPNG